MQILGRGGEAFVALEDETAVIAEGLDGFISLCADGQSGGVTIKACEQHVMDRGGVKMDGVEGEKERRIEGGAYPGSSGTIPHAPDGGAEDQAVRAAPSLSFPRWAYVLIPRVQCHCKCLWSVGKGE